jgi:hypothetical protein
VGAPFDVPPVLAEPLLAQIGDAVHAVGRVRAAVDVDHRLEDLEELRVPLLRSVAERLDVHGKRRR